MKNLILGLAFTLISAVSFACHIDPLGYCQETGKSYFITRVFNPNSFYEFRITGTNDVILTFTTGANVSDSIISFNILPGTGVELQYKYIANDWITTSWLPPVYSANYQYAGCGALPVRISNFYAQRKSDSILFSFNTANETGIKYYNIQGSANGKDFVLIDRVEATGSNHYSIFVANKKALAVIITAFIFLAFKEDRKYMRFVGLFLFAVVIFFYSCKKENLATTKTSEYKIFKVEAVDFSDNVVDVETSSIH